MGIRNFFLSANIDGNKVRVTGGPRQDTGGFDLKIYQRDKGEVTIPVEINGFADEEGNLKLKIYIKGHETVILETER